MTKEEAIKLLRMHRDGNIKPTVKVKEAINTLINFAVNNGTDSGVNQREKQLMNRCMALSSGSLCCYCGYRDECPPYKFWENRRK